MSSSPVQLLDASRNAVDAEIFDQITEADLVEWEQHWRGYRVSTTPQAAAAEAEHSHWNWRAKEVRRHGLLANKGFALRCGGTLEGLMFTKNTLTCRLAEQAGKPLIYIEYLESAPWNRLAVPVRYRGVGSALLRAAMELSLADGFHGRVGLHSLPGSIAWYRQLGLSDLGGDSACQDLHYFEMTPAQTQRFLA